jgi:hypothetical protein
VYGHESIDGTPCSPPTWYEMALRAQLGSRVSQLDYRYCGLSTGGGGNDELGGQAGTLDNGSPKRTMKLMCNYALAGDVRKQTERTVNAQCPYGTRRQNGGK